jgi:transposase InsO family protein
VASVAAEFRVSRTTAYRWWRRFEQHPEAGQAGLADRSSRPRRPHGQTPRRVEARIVALRRREKLGPARIAYRLGLNPATVHRVLVRHDLHRLDRMHAPSGRVIRRYEHPAPGDLIHVDVKKLGVIPPGGGWRVHGRGSEEHRQQRRAGRARGYDKVHSAVDDHSRLAYSEVLPDESGSTCAAFLTRAIAFFADHGISVKAVMTDNAMNYVRSRDFSAVLDAHRIKHVRIRPYRPQTNGKVERFNRTLAQEWAYRRPYRSSAERSRALDKWLHTYNYHRAHTALNGLTPVERTNLAGQNN